MPQVEFDPRVLTPVLLDTHSVYRLQALHFTSTDDVFRITGTFPRVRYFSFQVHRQPAHTRERRRRRHFLMITRTLFCHRVNMMRLWASLPPASIPRPLTLPHPHH